MIIGINESKGLAKHKSCECKRRFDRKKGIQINGRITINTAQKMKFFIKDFLSKCDQILSFLHLQFHAYFSLRIWSHLLKKSLMENFIFLCSEMLAWL